MSPKRPTMTVNSTGFVPRIVLIELTALPPSDGCLEINQVTVPQAHCLRGATKAKIGSRRLISFLNDGAHLEDREIHRDHQAADEHTEDGHDQRFQQGAHVVDRVVHVFFEEVRDLTRHFIQ